MGIDHLPRRRPGGLFNVLFPRIIYRHHRAVLSLAEPCGQLRRLLQRIRGDLPLLTDNHMAPRHVLGMQPHLVRSGPQGQPVVLCRVLAHQDLDAVTGKIPVRVALGQLPLLPPVGDALHVPGADQLLADLLQFAFPFALANVQQHALQIVQLRQRFLLLHRGGLPGVPSLLILFEITLGVLCRGQPDVQRHGDLPAFLAEPVRQPGLRHPLLQLIQVGVDGLAHHTVFIHFLRRGQLFLLHGQLFFASLQVGLQRPHHGCAFLIQPVLLIPGAVVGLQGSAHGLEGLFMIQIPAQIGKRKNIPGFSLLGIKHPGSRHLRHAPDQLRGARAGLRQLLRPGFSRREYPIGGFLRADAAQSGDGVHQRLGEGHACAFPYPFLQRLPCDRFGVQLVLGGRGRVGQSGLNLPDPVHVSRHMPRCFQDSPVFVQQDQVAVSAHDLQHQPASHMIPQLVHGIHVHVHDPVAFRLGYAVNPSARQLLAHQHAEGRRLQRVGKASVRQVASGVVRRCAQQQLPVLVLRPDQHHHQIPLRLINPVNPAPSQHLIQFSDGKPHRQSVHGHLLKPPCLFNIQKHP